MSSEASRTHVPVMLDRVVSLLSPALDRPGAVFVDATVGLGGHSEALLTRFDSLHLVGLDRDPPAPGRPGPRPGGGGAGAGGAAPFRRRSHSRARRVRRAGRRTRRSWPPP